MEIKDQLQELMEFAIHANDEDIEETPIGDVIGIETGSISDVRDLQEGGYLTEDSGFVVTMKDGSKVMVRVTEI